MAVVSSILESVSAKLMLCGRNKQAAQRETKLEIYEMSSQHEKWNVNNQPVA